MVWHSAVRKLKLLLNVALLSFCHSLHKLPLKYHTLLSSECMKLPSLIHLHVLTMHALICLINY